MEEMIDMFLESFNGMDVDEMMGVCKVIMEKTCKDEGISQKELMEDCSEFYKQYPELLTHIIHKIGHK